MEERNHQPSNPDITALLARSSNGDIEARNQAVESLCGDLGRRAYWMFSRRRGLWFGRQLRDHTSHPTVLVEEAFIKIFGEKVPDRSLKVKPSHQVFENREYFLNYCAEAMSSILNDYARKRLSQKGGGAWVQVAAEDRDLVEELPSTDYGLEVNINPAYESLRDAIKELPPHMAGVVEKKYFLGFTDKEAALELGMKASEVQSTWKQAKLLLQKRLGATAQ